MASTRRRSPSFIRYSHADAPEKMLCKKRRKTSGVCFDVFCGFSQNLQHHDLPTALRHEDGGVPSVRVSLVSTPTPLVYSKRHHRRATFASSLDYSRRADFRFRGEPSTASVAAHIGVSRTYGRHDDTAPLRVHIPESILPLGAYLYDDRKGRARCVR